MFHDKVQVPKRLLKDPFAFIAFWQFLTFLLLLLIIWGNELNSLPSLFFGERQEFSFFRGCILSAGAFFVAILTIGNTYLQQKRVLKTLVVVCAKCQKVCVNQEDWTQMEHYVSENSVLTFTHTFCPKCCASEVMSFRARIDSGKPTSSPPSSVGPAPT
ncbi:MAG: hypothetical protein HY343_01165 [Lentisphaerae bacterium]|nr:hypothetical protein [Lentisphaerota bacterium]